MRLDVGTSVFTCNDDGVGAARPRTIHSGCTQRSLHAPRCFELPLNDMHLILHLRGCGIPFVMLAQSCDPCRLLGLLHPASHGSDSS